MVQRENTVTGQTLNTARYVSYVELILFILFMYCLSINMLLLRNHELSIFRRINQIIVKFILNVLFCLSCFICFEHDMYNVICDMEYIVLTKYLMLISTFICCTLV